ncbi:MAG: hypothetical protein Q7J15_09035 [Candidatus Desulfaltia sp.]|nr:hypothetical protein [Candidatus Desulfaltia sp.]
MKGSLRILYHIVVIILSAAIALSLPYAASFIARNFLAFWSLIENEMIFLVSIEIACAVLLIFFFNYIGRSWKDRKLANAAKSAGLAFALSSKGLFTQKKIKRLKEKQGTAKDTMVIGSTGFRTFVDPKGDLHEVIKNCREVKIMLLNPYSEGASIRASSIPEPDITTDHFREQIKKGIDFLKGLNEIRRNVRLKLYNDVPFLKLTILGDYIWVQHYHAGLDVRVMPEYVFEHSQNSSGFYTLFYQYFLSRWNDPEIPEYDFDTEELIYRDSAGNEIRREKFDLTCDKDLLVSTS